MEESDLLKNFKQQQKKYAEYITPIKMRELLKEKLGDVRDSIIFDPALGSGQLIAELDCKKKIGVEIQKEACNKAVKNGIDTVINQDYILFDDSAIDYDIVITNYPFSLKPTDGQKKFFERAKGCKFKGVLDKVFIEKSFKKAKLGYYLSFPGILYRRAELSLRQWMIDNRYLKEVCWFEKSGFDATDICISLIVLDRLNKNEKISLKTYEDYQLKATEEISFEELKAQDYTLSPPRKINEEETIDLKKFNEEYYNVLVQDFIKRIKLQFFLKTEDAENFTFLSNERIKKDLSPLFEENII